MDPTTPEAQIYEALALRVVQVEAGIGLPVAYPQRSFQRPADGKYVRMQHIPNSTQRVFIGSRDPHRHFGLLQLSVIWPVGDDELEPKEYAGHIARFFPADYKMRYGDVVVKSLKHPSVAGAITGDTELEVPVTVEYESYI